MGLNIKQLLKNKSNDYSEIDTLFELKTGKSLTLDSCSIEDIAKYNEILSASVVIPVWNGEEVIIKTLTALEKSSFNQKFPQKLQIIVTDDGSTDSTLNLLKNINLNINLTILHQENYGQGPAMNAGISVADGDVIIEVDSDTILNYFAIENLMCRHQVYKNALYTGFRHYVDKDDHRVSLELLQSRGPDGGFHFMNDERINFPISGWPNNMCLASNNYLELGNSKGLWMANDDNNDPWILADMVFGMLFSLPRDIFKRIGGFDDRFRGWGCDDGYVGAKAISEGLFVIPVYTATGFHISHPFRTTDVQSEYSFNRKFFFDFINSTNYDRHPDWISIAKKRVKKQFTHKVKQKSLGWQANIKIPKEFSIEQLILLGKFDEAYGKLKTSNKKNDTYFINLCKIFNGKREYNKTINLLRNKSNMKPEHYFELAMALSAKGNFTKANKVLKIIAKLNPNYSKLSYWFYRDEELSLRQGEKYMKEEFYDVAVKCFEAILIANPNHKNALINREICIKKIII